MKTRKILAALIAILAFGQGAWAATITWTVKGGNNNSPAAFYAQFTDGSTLTSQVNWTYDIDAQISFNLRTNLTLTLTNSSKQLLVHEANYIGGRGSTTLTLSGNDYYYIYRVRLLDSNGNVIQLDANGNAVNHGGVSQCDYWNMAKSFSHTYANGILFSKIEISYGTYIPITDAVISGLNSQYTVSNVPVTPVPTVTWHGNTLTKGTHYNLTYQNNAAAGTATVNVVGSGMFNSQVSANYDLVWATYSVHFNANGGSGNMDNEPFTYGETKALTANAFTREGYTFAGWSTTANGAAVYTDGQEVSNLTTTDGATVTLYAKWTAHTYTVRFDANGGTGNMDDEPFTYGEAKALTANAFTREYHDFAGWSATANGDVVYTDGQSVNNLTATNGATVTLYAKWTELSPVSYIDADGTEKNATAMSITESQTEYGTVGETNWYVVSGEVNLSKLRFWDDETLLILEDGARLTINLSEEFADGALYAYNNITIYGQSNGTGRLVVIDESFSKPGGIEAQTIIINSGNIIVSSNKGLCTSGSITINGGSVTATGFDANGSGLYSNSGITINGGSVIASGRYGEGNGIFAGGSIVINGGSVKTSVDRGIYGRNVTITDGNVEASGTYYGIYANGGNITIDGGNVKASSTGSDGRGIYAGTITISRGIVEANGGNCGINGNTIMLAGGTVTASKYRGTIRIQSGLKYTDGTTIYTGRLSDEQIAAIAGKTMAPYVAPSPDLTLVQGTKGGVTAFWGTFYDSGSGYTLPAGAAAYTMDAEYHLYRLGTDGSVIPKGTAVVIMADQATISLTTSDDAQATDNAPGGNILVGRDVATEIDRVCALSVSASGAVGFYPLSGIALPAHKAGYIFSDGLGLDGSGGSKNVEDRESNGSWGNGEWL